MRWVKRIGSWALITCVVLYVAGTVTLALLWTIAPQWRWWVALSNVFAPLFFLPLLVLIPAALVIRSRPVYILTALPAIVFVVLFGNLFIPRINAAEAGQTIRVATFNQLYKDSNVADILQAIRAQDADVVAIQELHTAVAEALQRELGSAYPYQLLSPQSGPGGLGIISRHPMVSLDPERNGGGPVIVDVNGHPVTIANVHIHFSGITAVRSQRFMGLPYFRMYDMEGRRDQAEQLLQRLAPLGGPLLVMGDFNTGDREPGYALLSSQLRDVYKETSSGFGYTFPNNKRMGPITIPIPLVRIDYIWARGAITPLSSYVQCASGGSDHCMVVADLQFPNH
jgi:vancomycin resistance protein VanJ